MARDSSETGWESVTRDSQDGGIDQNIVISLHADGSLSPTQTGDGPPHDGQLSGQSNANVNNGSASLISLNSQSDGLMSRSDILAMVDSVIQQSLGTSLSNITDTVDNLENQMRQATASSASGAPPRKRRRPEHEISEDSSSSSSSDSDDSSDEDSSESDIENLMSPNSDKKKGSKGTPYTFEQTLSDMAKIFQLEDETGESINGGFATIIKFNGSLRRKPNETKLLKNAEKYNRPNNVWWCLRLVFKCLNKGPQVVDSALQKITLLTMKGMIPVINTVNRIGQGKDSIDRSV